jgi:hypothetical protein
MAIRMSEARLPLAPSLVWPNGYVIQILGDFDIDVWYPEDYDPSLSNEDAIDSIRVDHSKQWFRSGLIGYEQEYPIDSDEDVEHLVDQFVAMFPVYQATCERLGGVEDRFRDYFRSLLALIKEDPGDSLNPEPSAIEGEIVHAMVGHRRREQRLRDEKIRQVREATGRLRCEVDGCGFDFFEVYGETGEGFAHVHHLQPLGGRPKPSQTDLSDLKIVCANCHAMIHRGGGSRPLEGLIKRKPTRS